MMETISFSNTLDRLKAAFEAHGVDASQPLPADREEFLKQRDQRQRKQADEMLRLYEQQKAKVYQYYSLWPNDQPLTFEFKDWKPALQANEQIARQIGTRAFRLAKQLSTKPFNVFMNGTPGVGKTSLALAMMAEAKKQGLSTMFVSTTILQRLASGQYEDPTIAERLSNTERAMKEVDLLVLDDFGTEGGTLDKIKQGSKVHLDLQRRMYEIANARWDDQHNRPKGHTIITSNNLESELIKIYDPKVISRLIPRKQEYRIGFNSMKDVRGIEA